MNVEYTGRQYETHPTIRKEVETGLNKIRKILGDRFETKVILAVEKRRHKAEITINPPNGPIVGLAQAGDMVSAVNDALDHLHKQALKYKTKWLSKKRKAGQEIRWRSRWRTSIEAALGLAESATVSVTGHKFPSVAQDDRSPSGACEGLGCAAADDSGRGDQRSALPRPDVFVFRDPEGKLMVLHRTRDGKMELIEAP